MKITIENYDTKLTAEIPDDSDLGTVTNCIMGMIVSCGWSLDLMKDYFKD